MRKVQQRKAEAASRPDIVCADGPGSELRMTLDEMRSLDLHEARVNMQAAIRDKFALQEQLLNLEYVKQRDVLRAKQREAEASMNAAKQDYNTARTAAQQRLGVSLDDYTVREDGILRLVRDMGDE